MLIKDLSAIVFGIIAAQMVVLLCSSWILIYGGVFYLGFGGGNWTSDIAKNYFKVILAQAMQVFTFYLLIGIGQAEIFNLTVGLRTTKNVLVANYWWLFGLGGEPTKVVQSETLTLSGMCVCLVFAIILAILVSRVPGLVAGVITGSSITAMAFGGVGGAMSSASGIVTGGAMIASQAAGAGLALASAYKASVSGLSAGGGECGEDGDSGAGASKGSSGMGGLAGVMSGGLSFAYSMAANLASGAAGAVKDDLQKTTAGGRMSAMIEANMRTQGVGDKQAGGDDGRSGGDGDADPTGTEGMGIDNADGGSNGVKAGNGGGKPDFGGGAIGSGTDTSTWGGTWEDAVAKYDPGKIGLPDS